VRRPVLYWELRCWELFPSLAPQQPFATLPREVQVLLWCYAALRDREEHHHGD